MTETGAITEEYVRERLARAVHALAISDGALPERLFCASLEVSTLHPRDFVDEEGRAGFGAIREMLTRREPLANEGRVRATLARMSHAEARAVAVLILDLDAHYRPFSPFEGTRDWEGGPS